MGVQDTFKTPIDTTPYRLVYEKAVQSANQNVQLNFIRFHATLQSLHISSSI